MLRIRDEEQTLEKSIKSLFALKIPYEIIVILHLCTDNSENICKKLQEQNDKIKIFYYQNEISKCGYENLCTDKNSPHSVVKYYNWCLEKTSLKWKFKWDGDFIASQELIDFLNNNDWESTCENNKNIRYGVVAKNSTNKNCEFYLSDSITGYSKYLFREVPIYSSCKSIVLDDSICIIHDSELSNCKAYWKKKSWFLFPLDQDEINLKEQEDANKVKEKYFKLINDFGIEPEGMARSSNPSCDKINLEIINKKPNYVNFYE